MSVYSNYVFYNNGRSVTRANAATKDQTVFFWDNIGNIKIVEYPLTPEGELPDPSTYRRVVRYDTLHDVSNGISWSSPSPYDGTFTTAYGDEANHITMTDVNDIVYANGGDDFIQLMGGYNIAYGGADLDTLIGGDKSDILFGNMDDDILIGWAKNDYLFGGNGLDNLHGGSGNDILSGGADHDYLEGGSGDDIVYDIFGNNTVKAGSGEDFVITGNGHDDINLHDGNDIADAGGGNDIVRSGAGDDNITGGDGNDELYGQSGDDVLQGGAGGDKLKGGEGDDFLNGWGGADRLYGEGGDDILYADSPGTAAADDYLYGGAGNDRLISGNGFDRLFGDEGDDLLIAMGGDKANMTGGAGADIFAFGGFGTAAHHILDFGADDVINVSDMLHSYDPVTSVINDFVRLNERGDRTDILVDADGTGTHFKNLVTIHVAMPGVTVDDLISTGQLMLDTKLLGTDF